MRVSELLEMLRDQPPDAEVELAVVAPVDDEHEDITVDRYTVEVMLPWNDEESDGIVIWLVGGDDEDLEAFLFALEHADDDEHEHDHDHSHDGHTHGGHTHPH